MDSIDRPLTQKEKAALLGVHPSTVSAMSRAGLSRRATGRETIAWYQRHETFRTREIYPRR